MSRPGPAFSNSTETHWWDQLAAEIEAPDDGPLRHSAEWYAAMRDAHAARFPDADERSKANMRWLAEDAARREAVQA